MTTSPYTNKAEEAITSTADNLTDLLRSELAGNNWPVRAINAVSIVYENSALTYSFEGEGAALAQTLEFGSEDVRPSGAVRKFLNRPDVIEAVYLQQLERQFGDLL